MCCQRTALRYRRASHEGQPRRDHSLIKTLELYLARDHDAVVARWEAKIRHVQDALTDIPHISFERKIDSETYIVPKLLIHM